MNKIILTAAFFAASCATVLVSCKKKVDCTTAAKELATASQNYITNNTKATCDAYKAALQTVVDGNCSGQAGTDTYKQMISSLDCK